MRALGRHIVTEQRLEASDTTKSKKEPEKTKFFLKPHIKMDELPFSKYYIQTKVGYSAAWVLCVCKTSTNCVQTHDHQDKNCSSARNIKSVISHRPTDLCYMLSSM